MFFTFLLPFLVLLFLELLGAPLVKSLNLCDLHHLQSARGCGDSPCDQIRKHFLFSEGLQYIISSTLPLKNFNFFDTGTISPTKEDAH